jgi:hypothetical protein
MAGAAGSPGKAGGPTWGGDTSPGPDVNYAGVGSRTVTAAELYPDRSPESRWRARNPPPPTSGSRSATPEVSDLLRYLDESLPDADKQTI